MPIALMEREPRVAERIHEVIQGRIGHELVTPNGDIVTVNWKRPRSTLRWINEREHFIWPKRNRCFQSRAISFPFAPALSQSGASGNH
jgi:hypothetical protein